jgi:hypothetical protein
MALVVAAAALSSCSTAFSWQCSTPNGKYRHNRMVIREGSTTLSGQINVTRADVSGDWAPKAVVAFTDASKLINFDGSGDCLCNGVRAMVYPQEPDVVRFFLIANGQEVGMAQGPVGTPITFKIDVDTQDLMTVTIGKTNPVVQRAQLAPALRNQVRMSCSSGDVSFMGVRAE